MNPIKPLAFYKKLPSSQHNLSSSPPKTRGPNHSDFPTRTSATLQPTLRPLAVWENLTIESRGDGIWERKLVNCLNTPHT
jgi:hypothetical protein